MEAPILAELHQLRTGRAGERTIDAVQGLGRGGGALHLCGEQCAQRLAQPGELVLAVLHDLTGADEIMLVTMGHSREVQARTLELIADHYGLPQDVDA